MQYEYALAMAYFFIHIYIILPVSGQLQNASMTGPCPGVGGNFEVFGKVAKNLKTFIGVVDIPN